MKILDAKNAATFRPQRQTETRLEQSRLSALQTASAKELLYIATCKTMSNVHMYTTQTMYTDTHTHTCIDTVTHVLTQSIQIRT